MCDAGARMTLAGRGRKAMLAAMLPALALGGCGGKARTLPADPIDLAATCGVVAAATERQAAGVKGDLSADAQQRIFHYPLLAASQAARFDADRADAVFKRMPTLFDATIKGKWQALRPACAAAFPATRIAQPMLPPQPLDAVLQCYVLVDFMRKALGGLHGSYSAAAERYDALARTLDTKVSPALAHVGIRNGPALQNKRAEALAAAARLGQPQAVIAACGAKYK